MANRIIKKYDNIFVEIFKEIYSQLECNIIYVFLCGGACKEGSQQIRNNIKEILESKSKNKIQVLYPENLFFEKNSKQLTEFFKKDDLLHLETILANNSNVICIICESMGSATELGAFTNYKTGVSGDFLNKIVAVTYKKFKCDEPSFISAGPIKRIEDYDSQQHKIYKQDKYTRKKNLKKFQEELAEELIREFERLCKKNNKNPENRIFLQESVELNNFIGLSYFILLLVYFFDSLTNVKVVGILQKTLDELGIIDLEGSKNKANFDKYYNMAKRFLFDIKSYIEQDEQSRWKLTNAGLTFLKENVFGIFRMFRHNQIDYIRIKAQQQEFYGKMKGDYTF